MKKRLLFSGLFLLALLLFTGCSSEERDFTGQVKVVYELEGGTYQNCQRPVEQYYAFEAGTVNTIAPPDTFSGKDITRAGYTLEGWYTDRVEAADGTVTYRNRWDFNTDRVGDDGITLYARWKKNVSYTYEVCYYNDDGTVQVLGSYPVNAGEAFDDYLNYANKRSGYTALGSFTDGDGNPWDMTAGHPGGETNLAIRVFPAYIEGNYRIIRTASELSNATTANLYLMNDIDFEGKSFKGFGDYKGTILGNGHSIGNFTLSYGSGKTDLVTDPDLDEEGNLLCISLFRSLNGATLKDVSFTDFVLDVDTSYSNTRKILVAPLCTKIADSTLENVTVSAGYRITKLPGGFPSDNLIVVAETLWYFRPEEDGSVLENTALTMTNLDAGE